MNVKEKIEELREASEDGTITAAQVTEAGLHRSVLQKFVKSGEIYRFGRGLYVWSDVWEDDFYLLQRKYGRGIYSHDTALYLRGYSDYYNKISLPHPFQNESGRDIFTISLYFLISRDFPVISFGCSMPISSIRVGAMSARQPPSLNV